MMAPQTDGQLLKEFAAKRTDVTLTIGKRLGPTKSSYVLRAANSEYDDFAFCDQDDVWAPAKLQYAVEALEQYSSDEPLSIARLSNMWTRP